ncbi:RagB/SusD family nutrient uptake outer membrane protein [Pedobacter gandavensis]|uniref:RagB/SusD family nutrient uptake outer membrane protein n=1 Tax=Pedobacter gandavensis TaxID=2679963 RepID=A0ABR6EQQ1_9SPHI|nr:RagB/SusD family nutrient uptake outer membrane protein [Pedobacter gandavensis]MBB2147570.1 RagB/SusD family nutrient uptake outer membrane protein [Pedobacter gandavensis]
MKKIIIYILILSFSTSCKKVLDVENINSYSPEKVWNDPNLANAYMANIYSVFGNWDPGADFRSDQLAGVPFYPDAVSITNGGLGNWDYGRIRLINQALIDVEKGSLSTADKNNILGQAYFLRAYIYFSMVRTYGGVPYIKIPQDRYADDLDVPRNSTKECFEFIVQDLDQALTMLTKKISSSSGNWGKIDGNFALAFKAKVLLYKASPQFNPSNPWDNAYWADAYAANKLAYTELKSQDFRLVDNYSNIALTEKNTEVVFSVINKFPNKVASWDNGTRPGSLSRGPAGSTPTWNFVKAFPMKDGKLYNDPSGAYFKTEEEFLKSYWENRDPRFGKSFLWNAKAFPVSGKVDGYRQYTGLGVAPALDNFGVNPNASDKSENGDRYSGLFITKSNRLDLKQEQVEQYDTDFVLMRFAEVMLNYAEAANETGQSVEAIDMLTQIRQRAGIAQGVDGKYGITATSREQIRKAIVDERNVELCFEGHRFNDLRRWRMFSVLNNNPKYGIEAIAILPGGAEMPISQAANQASANQLKEEDFKYVVLQIPRTGVLINVLPDKYYFAPISQSIIGKTKKLEQNKDWGGTFDPTLH